MFDERAKEVLGVYVYGLFDSGDPWPFYIGKGVGNRVFTHVQGGTLDQSDDEMMSLKQEKIAEIQSAGRQIVHKILRFQLSQSEALKVEATLIDLVNHIKEGQLTNAISGQGVSEGIYATEDLIIALKAEKLVTEEPVLLIKIEKKWTELLRKGKTPDSITVDEIYDAVKGDWNVSMRRANTASCVLAVARGIVRAAIVPQGWQVLEGTKRKRMTGFVESKNAKAFSEKSVAHLFSAGSQNPVRYLNC